MITIISKTLKESVCKLFFATLVPVLFLGCGGSSSSSSQSATVSGVAIDGYIVGAKACIDVNGNQKCDIDEPSSMKKGARHFFETRIRVPGTLLSFLLLSLVF